MPRKLFPIGRDELEHLYCQEKMTTQQIADLYGIASQTVQKHLCKKGIESRPRGPRPGEDHPGWQGGRIVDKSGYILVHQPDHPRASRTGYVREHRLVMEQQIGRYLEPREVVHHKDDNKQNNNPDNLELFSKNSEHLRHTLKGKCPKWSKQGKANMQAGVDLRKAKLPEKEELERLYAKMSAAKIGRMFGCSESAVLRRVQAYGIPKNPDMRDGLIAWPSLERIAEMLQTMTVRETAKVIGCRPGTVYSYLEQFGAKVADLRAGHLPPLHGETPTPSTPLPSDVPLSP